MNKRTLIIFGLIGVIAIGLASWWNNYDNNPEVIKVGVVVPQSGELAFPGKRILHGAILASEEGIKDTNLTFKVYTEDSKGNPKDAVSATEKLLSANKVDYVVGDMLSSATISMVPIVDKYKKYQISPTASSPSITNISPNFFRVWPSDSLDAIISSNFAYNDLGLRKIAIVYWNNDYTLGLKDVFKNNFEVLGGKILMELAYNENINDASAIVNRLKHSGIEGIYLPGNITGNAAIVKKIKEVNFDIKLILNLTAQEQQFRNLVGNAIDGLYYTNLSFDDDLFSSSDFCINYKKRFNEEPDIQSLKGYEAMKLISLYYSTAHRDKMTFRDYILSQKTFDFYSDVLEFSETGDVKVNYSIYQYSGTETTLVKTGK